jgi:DNA mismatch repair protein MutS2
MAVSAETLKTLNFDLVVQQLANFAVTEKGKEIAYNLTPFDKFEKAFNALKETTEARSFYEQYGTLPFLEFIGAESLFEKIKVLQILSGNELLRVASILSSISETKQLIRAHGLEYPLLNKYAEDLATFKSLITKINNTVEPDGTISEKASPLLGIIRREIHATYVRIQTILQHIIYSKAYEGVVQDQIITKRNGRYVIPIKQSGKNAFPCVVQDESSSRLTLFVEPLSVVDLNNKLVELAAKEKQEIERIVLELEQEINKQMEAIEKSLQTIYMLDFVFAKAKLSLNMEASEVQFTNTRKINIVQGRHPFIPRDRVVPIDVSVGEDYYMLIITGPNTGGKTVTLKTIGLFSVMTQSGLHVPAYSNSEIGFFDKIFADIGDEQSIEQNLSTFSAHLKKIVNIIEEADRDSLVLIDELGAGTDPEEGSALGFAILKELYERRIVTVVSTHHSRLKEFPYEFSFAKNASVGFDIDTLKPTYKLYIGVPGESHAFVIAERLGLPKEVLESAKNELSEEHLRAEEYLSKLSRDQKAISNSREEIERREKEIADLQRSYEEKIAYIDIRKKREIKKAYEEARRIVKETKNKMDDLLKDLENEIKSQKKIQELRKSIKSETEKMEAKIEENTSASGENRHLNMNELEEGDIVYIKSFNQQGIVIQKSPDKGKVIVQMGAIRATLPITDIFEPMGDVTKSKREQEENKINIPDVQVPMKLDLHGYTVEEALEVLDKYLDNAYLVGLPFVYIVHGKGSGALRNAIIEYLRKRTHVAHFRTGDIHEGGTGVTIVYLK